MAGAARAKQSAIVVLASVVFRLADAVAVSWRATDANRGFAARAVLCGASSAETAITMKDAIYAFAAILCGIGFYFTIIGVFELPAACLSLVLFIGLVVSVWVFQRDGASP